MPPLSTPPLTLSLSGGNQYWFGLRKPPCQFLFSVCPCLQLFGNVSYSLYTHNNNNREANRMTDLDISVDIFPGNIILIQNSEHHNLFCISLAGKKSKKKVEQTVAPVMTLEMPD